MDRMSENENDRLQQLFIQYRDACPDAEPGPSFTPGLWKRIEARRMETAGLFKRLAQVFVMATAVLALFISGVLMPSGSSAGEEFDSSSYVELLAADHVNSDYVQLLPSGEDAR